MLLVLTLALALVLAGCRGCGEAPGGGGADATDVGEDARVDAGDTGERGDGGDTGVHLDASDGGDTRPDADDTGVLEPADGGDAEPDGGDAGDAGDAGDVGDAEPDGGDADTGAPGAPDSGDVGDTGDGDSGDVGDTGEDSGTTIIIDAGPSNHPPVITSSPVVTASVDARYLYVLQVSDPDLGDTHTYSLVTAPRGMAIDATGALRWVPSQRQTGSQAVTVRVADRAGAEATQAFAIDVAPRTVTCAPGSLDPGCAAAAWAHVVDADGLPVAGAAVAELGPQGARALAVDEASGLVLLGGGAAGNYHWTIEAEGHAPVVASAVLADRATVFVPLPRMAPLSALTATLTPGAATFAADVDGRVALTFPTGAVASATLLSGAVLDGQALPSWLPLGWSLAAGVYYHAEEPLQRAPTAHFTLPSAIPPGATLFLAEWVPTGEWIAIAEVTATSAATSSPEVDVELGGAGAWAIVVADRGPGAPIAVPGFALASGTGSLPGPESLVAGGFVDAPWQAASLEASDVTATGFVWATTSTLAPTSDIPSGLVLPARLSERYSLTDGTSAALAPTELAIALYDYPPAPRAPMTARAASFAIRPRYLFDPLELVEAVQTLDVSAEPSASAAVLGANGGLVSGEGVVVVVPPGVLSGTALVRVDAEPLDALEGLALDGEAPVAAFRFEWTGANLANGRLALEVPGLAAGATYVLARRVLEGRRTGWAPVERFHADAQGALVSDEPAIGARLVGLVASGSYALFARPAPEGLVAGTVTRAGLAATEALVTTDGAPWLVVTDASGAFVTIAAPGDREVRAERPSSGESGVALGNLADAASALTVAIAIGPEAPRIAHTLPADGASNVRVVTAIEVTFSEPVRSDSVPATGALTVTSAGGTVVAGTHTLRPDRRTLSFYPDTPLVYGIPYSVEVSGDIRDISDLPLTGSRTFAFTTELAPLRSTGAVRLISYAPGSLSSPCDPYDPNLPHPADFDPTASAMGIPGFDATQPVTCVVGTAGVAPPGAPVVLVNDRTGQTVTVASQTNGSFKSFIPAAEEDLLTAVIENAGGTRLTIALEQQRFDDGRVALYRSGGTLEAPNPYAAEPIQITIEPGAIPRRAVLGLTGRTTAELDVLTENTPPEQGTLIAGATLTYEGEPLREPADIRFPIPESDLDLPFGTDPEDAGFVLARVRKLRDDLGEEVLVYETLDRMQYEEGALVTHSWPMEGLLGSLADAFQAFDLALLSMPDPTTAFTGLVVACPASGPRGTACDALLSTDGATTLADEQSVPASGRRLAGATVIASRAANPARPGAIPLGAMAASTDVSGRYALAVAASASLTLRAIHRDYPAQAAERETASSGSGGVQRANLIFRTSAEYEATPQPHLVLEHSPARPEPLNSTGGTDATRRARLRITVQPLDANLEVLRDDGVPLVTGETILASDIQLIDVTALEVPPPPRGTAIYHVTCAKAALVRLLVRATFDGRTTEVLYPIYFGGVDQPAIEVLTPDPLDRTGPRVRTTWPVDRGLHDLGAPIVIELDEPIARRVLTDASAFELTPSAGAPSIALSADQRRLEVGYPRLVADQEYSLVLTRSIVDLANNPLNSDPVTGAAGASSSLTFRTAPDARSTLVPSGDSPRFGGVVVHGAFAYVLDRANGSVAVFDLSDPARPTRVHDEYLPEGYPRDLVLIPRYSYVRPAGSACLRPPCHLPCRTPDEQPWTTGFVAASPVQAGCAGLERTLLVVAGGLASRSSQYLRVFDVTNGPPRPTNTSARITRVASSPVTAGTDTIGRLTWSAPELAYLRWTFAVTSVDSLNLQTFIFGTDLTRDEFLAMPEAPYPGLDFDRDGDYADPGDYLPLPPRPNGGVVGLGYAGLEQTVAPFGTTQQVVDYAFFGPTRFVGVALSNGALLSPAGLPIGSAPASYQTLAASGLFGPMLPREAASFTDFGAPGSYELEAVAYLPAQRLRVRTATEAAAGAPGRIDVLDLAVVATSIACATPTPGDRCGALHLIDVTDPLAPRRVGPPEGIQLPGLIEKIEPDVVVDGVLRVHTSSDIFLLDLDRVTLAAGAGLYHPSILGRFPGLGSSLPANGDTPFGLQVRAEFNQVSFRGPDLFLVSFPGSTLVAPDDFLRHPVPASAAARTEQDALFRRMQVEDDLRLARVRSVGGLPSSLTPPSAAEHFYVMMYAPGGAGPEVELLAEVTDDHGRPLGSRGPGFAPVLAATRPTLTELGYDVGTTATIRPLVAHRLSNDPASAYFNVYLTDPFAVVDQKVTAAELETLRTTGGRRRELFHSGDGLRVSIDPAIAAGVRAEIAACRPAARATTPTNPLTPYASCVDGGRVVLGSALTTTSYPVHRILGPNPPPPHSPLRAPGTGDLLLAHNGDLELPSVDLTLPSPMMPLALVRKYVGQDYSDGAFGPGFDFNYAERVVEAKPENIPAGQLVMLRHRGSPDRDVVAEQKDVVLYDGSGSLVLFEHIATSSTPPSIYASDPLVARDAAVTTEWYRPEPGYFDALYRKNNGQWVRITPDGLRFTYNGLGRLERIEHRYEQNRHELVYGASGKLRAIRDLTFATNGGAGGFVRELRLVYYKKSGDTEPESALDEVTTNPKLAGRVRRLVDATAPAIARDTIYSYDARGRLVRVEGVNVQTTRAAGATGRHSLEYTWSDRFITAVRELGASFTGRTPTAHEGTAVIAAASIDADGRVTATTGYRGATTISTSGDNDATRVGTPAFETTVTKADGTAARVRYDGFALPREIRRSGPNSATSTSAIAYSATTRYRPETITLPRGNSITYVYDSGNANLRAQGNVVEIVRRTNGVGGTNETLRYQVASHDPRYNLPTQVIDWEGRVVDLGLVHGGRDIGTVTHRAGPGLVESTTIDGRTGQRRAHTAIDGTTSTWDYDPATGYLRAATAGAIQTTYAYGTPFAERLGIPSRVTRGTDHHVDFVHDELGREVERREGQHVVETAYDAYGWPQRVRTTFDAQPPYEERFEFEPRGFLRTRTQVALETAGATRDLVWEYLPDPVGRVHSVTTPESGTTTLYAYDVHGRPAQLVTGAQIAGYEYDVNGNLVRTYAEQAGARQTLEQREYDGHDRVARVIDGNGAVATKSYTASGATRTTELWDGPVGTSLLARHHVSTFDAVDRPTAWSEGQGATSATFGANYSLLSTTLTGPLSATRRTDFDASGFVTRAELVGVATVNRAPDAEGRVAAMTELEGAGTFETSYRYALNGAVEEIFTAGESRVAFGLRYDGIPKSATISPNDLALTSLQHRSKVGELVARQSPLGTTTDFDRDGLRRPGREGRGGGLGRRFTYDTSGRLTRIDYPDGEADVHNAFDVNGNPTNITTPVGTIAAGYDPENRLTSRVVTTSAGSFQETFGYDALNRLRSSAFPPHGSTRFAYSLLGVQSLGEVAVSGGQTYAWTTTTHPSGQPLATTYPLSGPTVTTARDDHGRLRALRVDSATVAEVLDWQMAAAPGRISLGNGLIREDLYDARRRLVARKYQTATHSVAELRYEYDDADRETARQYLHRAGRADLYAYDDDSRLTRAELGAKIAQPGIAVAPWDLETWATDWWPGDYGRRYTYDRVGEDRVVATSLDTWPGDQVPSVAASFGPADEVGHPGAVDGVARQRDPLGNTTQLELPTGVATLTYDALSRLASVTRADGTVITYVHRADGPLLRRTVTCGHSAVGCADTTREYVFDGLRLLEEHDAQERLARYYYADEGEIPFAADLGPANTRYYFVTDRVGSISGVLDSTGNWVERIRYDAWGRPTIEPADTAAPELHRVTIAADGDLVVTFTEPVDPAPLATSGGEVAKTTLDLATLFTLETTTAAIPLLVERDDTTFDAPRGTTLRLRPDGIGTSTTVRYTLRVQGQSLLDDWSNPAAPVTLTFNYVRGAVLMQGPELGATATDPIERSLVGNALLFQSHLYDDDADLYLMKARAFDPRTGLSLQRDPAGYEDSVNLYAGFGHDPVNLRDPTGMTPAEGAIRQAAKRALKSLGKRGATVSPHIARGHSFTMGMKRLAKRIAKAKGPKEIDEILEYAAKSKFRKPGQTKKLIERTLRGFDRGAMQWRGDRVVLEKRFGRAIGNDGERILRMYVSTATGKILSAHPTHTFRLASVFLAGGASLGNLSDASAQVRSQIEKCEEDAGSPLWDNILPIGVSEIGCEPPEAITRHLAETIADQLENELQMSLADEATQDLREAIAAGFEEIPPEWAEDHTDTSGDEGATYQEDE